MKKKIEEIVKQSGINIEHADAKDAAEQICSLFNVSQQRELLITFAKWYQMDEMQRKEKELFSSIIDRFLESNK